MGIKFIFFILIFEFYTFSENFAIFQKKKDQDRLNGPTLAHWAKCVWASTTWSVSSVCCIWVCDWANEPTRHNPFNLSAKRTVPHRGVASCWLGLGSVQPKYQRLRPANVVCRTTYLGTTNCTYDITMGWSGGGLWVMQIHELVLIPSCQCTRRDDEVELPLSARGNGTNAS